MAEFPPKISPVKRQRLHIKPSASVKRQLFGVSDSSETKRLLRELIEAEEGRFESRWNVDLRLISSTENLTNLVGMQINKSPASLKSRYIWKVEKNKVPSFYTKHFNPCHSEARLYEQENRTVMSLSLPPDRASPTPLTQRNGNAIPAQSNQIAEQMHLNKSDLVNRPPRLVFDKLKSSKSILPSCRNPNLAHQQSTSSTCAVGEVFEKQVEEDCCISRESKVDKSCNSHLGFQSISESITKEEKTKKTTTGRLFEPSRKRKTPSNVTTQLKITDMIPVCKLRSLSLKKACNASPSNNQDPNAST